MTGFHSIRYDAPQDGGALQACCECALDGWRFVVLAAADGTIVIEEQHPHGCTVIPRLAAAAGQPGWE